MMHEPYPDIVQFRNMVKEVRTRASYVGKDENGESVYKDPEVYPTIHFTGTTKLHGTNASICIKNGEIWCQSRQQIITPENDNAGFARFVKGSPFTVAELISQLGDIPENSTVAIYGEFVGEGVNSGCAIHQLDRAFYIFGVKMVNDSGEVYWLDYSGLGNNLQDSGVFNIRDFKMWSIDVDFNTPEVAQNDLVKYTLEVEEECPVAKARGVSGIGEGIVWTGLWEGKVYMFKTKGEKHSISKVKTLVPVDTEKLSSIQEFAEYAVTGNRFNQGMSTVFGDSRIDIKKLGDVLKWMSGDICKEESDVLESNGLTMKDVGRAISDRAKGMFMHVLNGP